MFFILNFRLFSIFNGTPDRKETYTYEGDSTNVAKVAYDDNADGKTDRVALNTHDANGNLVKTEYHNDGVETNPENRVETNSYDANGNLVQKAIDANGDGQIDTIETYTVNDKGQITGTSYADAKGNVYKSETYTLDNNGNITEKRINEDGKNSTGDSNGVDRIEKYELNAKGEAIKVSYDNNADGKIDAVDNLVLDANGNTLVKYVNADNDTSGTTGQAITLADGRKLTGVDKIETNTLNAKGQVVETLYDNNADKTADSRTEFVLDVNGNVVEEKRDLTNDGQIDKVTKYTLDAQGNQLTRADYNQLADGSQVLTQREEYTLDENGYRTGMTRYTGSGKVSAIEEYEVNALGQRTKAFIDNYGDKVIDRAEIYTLDANGYRTKTETDVGNDGSIDSNITYERDALGQIIKQSTDNNNDGIADSIRTSERDEYGKEVKVLTDSNGDGIPDSTLISVFNALGQATHTEQTLPDGRVRIADYTYDDYGQVKTDDAIWKNAEGQVTSTYRYTYERDDLGRVAKTYYDNKTDGVVDWVSEQKYDNPNFINALTEFKQIYPNGTIYTYTMEIDDAGTAEFSYRALKDGRVDLFALGDRNGNGTIARTEDATTWTDERLATLGNKIDGIRLGAGTGDTLTLSAEVVKKLIAGKLADTSSTNDFINVFTDGTDDTINLAGGFSKTTAAAKKISTQTYDLYTAQVDNDTVSLYIDSDTTVNILS